MVLFNIDDWFDHCMHISLTDSLKSWLVEYSSKRKMSQNAVIASALEKLQASEPIEPGIDQALREVLLRRMILPAGFSFRNVYSMLWMLGKQYPDMSARDFWGGSIYLLADNPTHRELLELVAQELKQWSKKN